MSASATGARFAIRARWAAPITAPLIHDACVGVSAGRLDFVGPYDACAHRDRDVFDVGDAVLLPGLINAHTHLQLTGYADRLPRGPLWPWVRALISLRNQPDVVERETAAIIDGARRSLAAGVTCVGDICRMPVGVAVAAYALTAIRRVIFHELISIAKDAPRTPTELDAWLADAASARDAASDELTTHAVSPHAPYTTMSEHAAAGQRLALTHAVPWSTHWCETPEESAWLRGDRDTLPAWLREAHATAGFEQPARAVEHLNAYASVAPGLLVHCNYVDEAQIARIVDHGHTVVYCPLAHAYYGHPQYPLEHLLSAGCNVALGTDSAASGATLSVLDEMRHVQQVFPSIAATDLFAMATVNAARGLRLPNLGVLRPGAFADLAAFPIDAERPLDELIDAPRRASHVWVAGKPVIG